MPKQQGTIGKVTLPYIGKVIDRHGLYNKLNEALALPVVWISGPAGAGKTCLAVSYISSVMKGKTCLWYQMDPGDADPATYFYYLGMAARKAVPKSRKQLPLFTPDYGFDIEVFSIRYFETLYSKLKAPAVLVFDNFQDAGTSALFHTLIKLGISRVPKGINILVLSRTDPWGGYIDLTAKNLIARIAWEDLKLTWEEIHDIASFRTEEKLQESVISDIYTKTNGWAAGVTLMLETAKVCPLPEYVGSDESLEDIFDYFADEILSRVDQEFKEFLFKTALFPWMDIDSAKAITGNSAVPTLFSKLTRSQYFITRIYRPKVAYQYHPLFRSFLLSRAREYYSPEVMDRLIETAANFLESSGEYESATKGYAQIQDFDSVIRLICANAYGLFFQGRYAVIQNLLALVPDHMLNQHPWLLFWKGASHVFMKPEKGRRYFETAFELFRSAGDDAGSLLSWAWVIDAAVMEFKTFEYFDPWIEAFDALRDTYNRFSDEAIKARVAGCMFKVLFTSRPWDMELEYWAENGISPENAPDALYNNMTIWCLLLNHYLAESGEFEKAARVLEKIRMIKKAKGHSPLSMSLVLYSEIYWASMNGIPREAISLVEEYRQLSKNSGIKVMSFIIFGLEIVAFLDINNLDRAAVLIDSMEPLVMDMKPWERSLFYAQKARFFMCKGDYSSACVFAGMSFELSEKVRKDMPKAMTLLLDIQAAHSIGKTSRCQFSFSRLSDIVQNPDSLLHYMTLMVKSWISFDSNDEKTGRKILEEALALGRTRRYVPVGSDIPKVTAFLCAKALEYGIETEYVQWIIKAKELVPQGPAIHFEAWPRPLHIKTLGRFEIYRNGNIVSFSRKAQQKPIDMLKAIIAFGGRAVSKDLISDELWPDMDGDKANQSFTVTLHRLRKLLGHPKLLVLSGGQITLQQELVWVDAFAFRYMTTVKPGTDDAGAETWRRLMGQILKVYKGPFLDVEEWSPAIIAQRDRLRQSFLTIVTTGVVFFGDACDFKQAKTLCKAGLEREPLSESLHKRLMAFNRMSGYPTK